MKNPPPVERRVFPTDDASCPGQFALCLDADAGLNYEHNLRTSRRWMKEAWAECSASENDGGVDGGF